MVQLYYKVVPTYHKVKYLGNSNKNDKITFEIWQQQWQQNKQTVTFGGPSLVGTLIEQIYKCVLKGVSLK